MSIKEIINNKVKLFAILLSMSAVFAFFTSSSTNIMPNVVGGDFEKTENLIFLFFLLLRPLTLGMSAFVITKGHEQTKQILGLTLGIETGGAALYYTILGIIPTPVILSGSLIPLITAGLAFYMHTSGALYREAAEKPVTQPKKQPQTPQTPQANVDEEKTISFMVEGDNMDEFQSNTQTAGTNMPPAPDNDENLVKKGSYGKEGWDTKRKVKTVVLAVILLGAIGYLAADHLGMLPETNLDQHSFTPPNPMPEPDPAPAPDNQPQPSQANAADGPQQPGQVTPENTQQQPEKTTVAAKSPTDKPKKNPNYLLGHKLLKGKKYREAINEFKKTIKGKAAKYTKLLAYYHIAKTFEKKMNNPKMALAYWKVLRKKPGHIVPKQTNLPKKAIKEVARLEKILKDPSAKSKSKKVVKKRAVKRKAVRKKKTK